MTKLVLIRHGQSMANATNRFAGHSDFDLSDLGRHQAELAAEYIAKHFKIDAIYASDLLRAYNTAVPSSGLLGLSIEPRKGLREIFAGKWESMSFEDIQKTYTADFDTW
jgi:broad specificity phosphatase PhoE